MTDIDKTARDARAHFLRWIEWYLGAAGTQGEPISQEELARRTMGEITASAISQWRKKGSLRYPNLRNVIIMHAVISALYPADLDMLLTRDPPPRR